jgi:hypothetical protein
MNSTKFQLMVEQIVMDRKINYMEAVIELCTENDIEFEDIKKLLTSNLRDKIKISAMEDGYLKTESSLPI